MKTSPEQELKIFLRTRSATRQALKFFYGHVPLPDRAKKSSKDTFWYGKELKSFLQIRSGTFRYGMEPKNHLRARCGTNMG